MKLSVLPFIVLMFFSLNSFAATCEIQYERTACPGKEKISYKKCKGQKNCSKFKEAGTVAECQTMAVKSCANRRLSITKSKVINALFDGKPIQSLSGKEDFCVDYEKRDAEFNRCDG